MMKLKITAPQFSAGRFDFVISISIIVLLAFILLFSLSRTQSQIESVMMEADLSNMRWGLRELWAHRNAIGQSLADSEINNANPLRLLSDRPNNYIGEYEKIPPDARSIWYFDSKAQRLVYVFSDGHPLRYRLTRIARLNRASLGAIGGIDLMQD